MARSGTLERHSVDLADFDHPVTCPAGERIAETPQGPACRCKIEEHTITASAEPTALLVYCMGNHTKCSTWQADREWRLSGMKMVDVVEPGRQGLSLLDQDPERVPSFWVPGA